MMRNTSSDTMVTYINNEDRRGSGDARIYIDDDESNVLGSQGESGVFPAWAEGGSSIRNEQNEDIVIEMDDRSGAVGEDDQNGALDGAEGNHVIATSEGERKMVPCYLRTYLRLLFYAGLSLYKGEYLNVSEKYGCINKVAFAVMSILTIASSVQNVKFYVLNFFADRTMLGFVMIGFFLNRLLCRTLFLLISIRKEAKLSKLLALLNGGTSDFRITKNHYDSIWPSVLLAVSITISTLFAINAGLPLQYWSLDYIIGAHSYRMDHFLKIWSTKDYTNTTTTLLFDNVDQDLTLDRLSLAFLGFVILCVGNVVDSVSKDVMFLSSITLKEQVTQFKKRLKNAILIGRDKIIVLRNHWEEYQTTKAEAAAISKVYGGLFTLMHINNLLLFAYFLLSSFQEDKHGFKLVTLLQLFLDIVKVSYTYYVAAKAPSISKDFLKWIHNNFLYNDYDNPEPSFNINVAMDELKTEPVGIGKGGLIITENFIFRLWTVITSYFVFLADAADNDDDDNDDDTNE